MKMSTGGPDNRGLAIARDAFAVTFWDCVNGGCFVGVVLSFPVFLGAFDFGTVDVVSGGAAALLTVGGIGYEGFRSSKIEASVAGGVTVAFLGSVTAIVAFVGLVTGSFFTVSIESRN